MTDDALGSGEVAVPLPRASRLAITSDEGGLCPVVPDSALIGMGGGAPHVRGLDCPDGAPLIDFKPERKAVRE